MTSSKQNSRRTYNSSNSSSNNTMEIEKEEKKQEQEQSQQNTKAESKEEAKESPSEELYAAALKFKEDGNAYFKYKKTGPAIEEYSKGIDLIDKASEDAKGSPAVRDLRVILLTNRSNCYNLEKKYAESLSDSDAALKIDSSYAKAYYRRGAALEGLERYAEAKDAFTKALGKNIDASGRSATQKKIKEIERRLQQQEAKVKSAWSRAFSNAIHVETPAAEGAARKEGWAADLRTLELAGASMWWNAGQHSPSENFREMLGRAAAVVDKAAHGKIGNEGERLLTVTTEYAGPTLSSPPTVAEVQAMAEYFKSKQRMVHPRYAASALLDALKTFKDLPALVDVAVPAGTHFTVCGDIHGQFYDLLHIFEVNGWPSADNPYLFNGDYVDRGSFSCEVLLTLFALRAALPGAVFLARGNHETINMNLSYGFYGEVESKLNKSFEALITEIFDYLPLAHVLAGKIFVVHGGLYMSDALEPPSLDEIRAVNRVRQPPEDGSLMSDLLWADPQDLPGRMPSKRGIGYSFGPDVTKRFLEKNGLSMIIRSHEVKYMGYEVMHDGCLATVFSAPNYCDRMGNLGAFAKFTAPEMKPEFVTFKESPHPNVKPLQYANPYYRTI